MGLFRQPPTSVLSFDPFDLKSSMVYHCIYHHSLALHLNHLVFLNTYIIGMLVTSSGLCGTLSDDDHGQCSVWTMVVLFDTYALVLTRGVALPYAAMVGGFGVLAMMLSNTVHAYYHSHVYVILVGLGIMLCSFAAQLLGHRYFERFAAPPHLFHGFVAAPLLEYSSLLFRLGLLPGLCAEVAVEVQKARGEAGARLMDCQEAEPEAQPQRQGDGGNEGR